MIFIVYNELYPLTNRSTKISTNICFRMFNSCNKLIFMHYFCVIKEKEVSEDFAICYHPYKSVTTCQVSKAF